MHPLLHRIWWRLSGVLVYALVGPSGSGKSHRARLVASRYNIPLIIDDGLLIRGDLILAGKSAKKEDNYLKAIKTAVFEEEGHRKLILETLETLKFKKILLLGTSLKMVRRLAYRLDLPKIYKVIKIEEIASPEEMLAAQESRSLGRHVIPAPIKEVSRHHGPSALEPVRVSVPGRIILFGRNNGYDKTIVLPKFHNIRPSVDIPGLKVLIQGWLTDFNPNLALKKLEAEKVGRTLKIILYFGQDDGLEWKQRTGELQEFLQVHLSQYSGWETGRSEILVIHQEEGEKE